MLANQNRNVVLRPGFNTAFGKVDIVFKQWSVLVEELSADSCLAEI